ncbi:MAG: DUF2019 domain-containing protein [Terricaulis sp.]
MMTLETLVAEFAASVPAQSEAIHRGDPTSGNKFAKQRAAIWEELRAQGDAGREALAALLWDKRADVRTMAAAYLLRYKHVEAKAVLEREAKGTGIIAFEAEQTLERWKEGAWSLDPA